MNTLDKFVRGLGVFLYHKKRGFLRRVGEPIRLL